MSRYILAILALAIAALHFFMGGQEIAPPLFTSDIPIASKTVLYACWHMVTAMLTWSAFVFYRGGVAAFHFGILWSASAIAFLWACAFIPDTPNVFLAPQWILLAPVGLLAIWSNRKAF